MHGVSAIIAIVLIIMIVVALAGLSYMFFTGIITSTTETTEESITRTTTGLLANAKIESISINDVYVRNVGQSDLTGFAVYLNDEAANFDISSGVVKPGETGTITIYDFIKEGDDIKVTTAEGLLFSKKAPDPCDEAVLCLEMDEGSGDTASDSAGHSGNDGKFEGETFNNGIIYEATRIDGKFGKGLKFDGVDDYVNVSDDNSLNFGTGDFTLAAWVKTNMDSTSSYTTIIAKVGSPSYYMLSVNANEKARFTVYDGTNATYIYGITNISDGVWHHIAAVRRNSTKQIELYVDGEQDATPITDISDYIDTSGDVLQIGRDRQYTDRRFNGTIDEVRIYNRSLTQEEIQAEMLSSIPITKTIVSYSFEESGQNVNDAHVWVKGKYSSALEFDGIDDYVNVSDSNSLDITDEITIEAWVKTKQENGGIVSKYAFQTYPLNWQNSSYQLLIWDNNIRFTVGNGSDYASLISDTELIWDNWYHVVGTFNKGNIKIFINGNIDKEDTSIVTKAAVTSWDILMGRAWIDFTGTIDELRIYNKAIY